MSLILPQFPRQRNNQQKRLKILTETATFNDRVCRIYLILERKEVVNVSQLLVAILAAAAPPPEGLVAAAGPASISPAVISAEETQVAPRTGPELREAVRAALRRWARPTDAQADTAAREFVTLYKQLQADDQISRSQRGYLLAKVRTRLMRLGDQIARRVARTKRLAKAGQLKTDRIPEGKADSLSQQAGDVAGGGASGLVGGPAFGGGPGQANDNGQALVELIQTVIRPASWDVNGGPGSIYYWYPGRAMVIRQTGEVHDEIGGVLEQLGRAGR